MGTGDDKDLETETELDDEAPTAHRRSSVPPRPAVVRSSLPPASSGRISSAPSAPTALPSSPPSADSGLSAGSQTSHAPLHSPREVLHRQEIARTRIFLNLCILLAIASGLTLPVVGGDPGAKIALLVGLVGVLLACGWLAAKIREDRQYTIGRAMFVAFVCITTVLLGIHFFGVWSPATALLPFGLFFFAQGQSARGIAAVYVACSVSLLGMTSATALGILPDRGLIRGDMLSGVERIAIIVMVQVVLAATFFLAKRTRDTMLEAIERHDRVVRSLARRDALLKEARQDLAQALRAEGLGHFSERTVGHWRLGHVLGRGAMGEVYEGVHTGTGQIAAVKLLREHLLDEPIALQRFFQEARLAAALDVENVVRVLEFSDGSSPVPFIAMERLQGIDLADHLRDKKRMSPRTLLVLLRHVGQGLDAARDAGIVHRDLKPRNLFRASNGNAELWKILDFGVSKLIANEGATLTRDVVGTPAYMAPEQALTQRVSHRTDLFSLAVIAYRALTGRPAFAGDSSAEILYKVVHATPTAPSDGVSLPAEVDLVFAIALAKDPADRFDSGAELARAFEAAWRGKLPAELVERAQRLTREWPWGSRGRAEKPGA